MKAYTGSEFRKIRNLIEKAQTDKFRFIDFDNSLKAAKPSINRVFVRYAGKSSRLSDTILDLLDGSNMSAEEPVIAPGLTDLVFEKIKEK